MGFISTRTGGRFHALLMSLMVSRLALVDRYPFQPCSCIDTSNIFVNMKPIDSVPRKFMPVF